MTHDYWEPSPPTPSTLDDHAVAAVGDCLEGKTIALLVCGGIAAFKAPDIARALRKHGAEVTAFVSPEALRYVTADALAWSTDRPVVEALSARAEHLGDGRRFDAYLLAPATYNTINKLRQGIADGLLTTVLASALGRLARGETQLLLAPTMHGSMHNPILEDSLIKLQELGVTVIPPRDAYGKHNLPEVEELVYRTARALSKSSLRGVPILVTGGPTPVAVDDVRRLTTHFTGQLGCEIAKALFVAGAEVHWIHGRSSLTPPAWLRPQTIDSYDEYREAVLQLLTYRDCRAAVFSAAVADYRPTPVAGKIPSGARQLSLELVPTAKVIQEVRAGFPELEMVTFKFEAGLDHHALMEIARQRLEAGYQAVVANRREEQQPVQTAWLVTPEHVRQLVGKPGIAQGIVAHLENVLAGLDFPSDQDSPVYDPVDSAGGIQHTRLDEHHHHEPEGWGAADDYQYEA